MNKLSKGFTLIELMITIAIAGILIAVAAPNMRDTLKNERLAGQVNLLISHLMLARSEALKRNQSVILCTSNNAASCTNTNAKDGWIVFVDADNSEAVSNGDEIIKIKQALEGSDITISALNKIIYDNRGFSPTSAGTFNICDDRGADYAKILSVSKTGRVRRSGTPTC